MSLVFFVKSEATWTPTACAGGEVPEGDLPPTLTPYPILDSCNCFAIFWGWPLIWRLWVWQLIFDSNSEHVCFFRFSDRTLISRVRIFVIWQKSVEFQAEAWFLVAALIWAISWHGGPVQTAGTVRERAAHKSRASWAFSSLGDYMRDLSHLRGSERELISQTRQKSAAGDSAEPKQ